MSSLVKITRVHNIDMLNENQDDDIQKENAFYFNTEVYELYQELNKLKFKIDYIKEHYFKFMPLDSRCPKNLKHFPEKPCDFALNTIYDLGDDSKKCEWHVLDSYSNYCFFVYSKFFLIGNHTLDEIADLTVSNVSLIDLYYKKSLQKFKKKYMMN